MKNSKKGISLIVLIITIIVIVILATAILVSVINNNPISEANKARYESDRDNMQAVFTNTVGKIMAENQGVVNVTAGQINTETTGVNETTGEVAYTVDNATVAENSTGTIKFDKGTNDATTYYTGKKLPIYAAGETKWYVDSEGVLTLEVAGVKYGSGEVESGSGSEEEVLAAGLYDEEGNMTKSWEQLIADGDLVVENGVLRGGKKCDICGEGYYTDLTGKLVIDDSIIEVVPMAFGCPACECRYSDNLTEVVFSSNIKNIGYYAFTDCYGLSQISISNNIQCIETNVFYNCRNLTEINYYGSQEQWNSIDFGSDWNYSCQDITVHCSDGDIIIPENNYTP